LKLADFEYELNSDDLDASDQKKGPKTEKFREEKLNKDFELKRGVEFISLREFKLACREWNVYSFV
jgi:hypothetical protein